jgi:hypothetical protein
MRTYEELRAEADDAVREAAIEQAAFDRFRSEHPGWCTHCYGEGWEYDSSVGVYNECPKCLAKNKCPRCGAELGWDSAKEWYEPCASCSYEVKE